jgi:uncharacterized membrane protein YgcG
MAKKRRRSGRPSRSPTAQAHPVKPPPARWWKRVTRTISGLGTVTKIIISVGTLAGAITAILTLPIFPKPAPENIGRFTSVQALEQVPLSHYRQRSAVFKLKSAVHPKKAGPVLAVAAVGQSSPSSIQSDAASTPPTPSPTTSPPTPSPTPTPTPSPTVTTPTQTVSPSGTASPTCTPTATGAPSATCMTSPSGTSSSSATGSPTGTASTGGIKMSPLEAVTYANDVAALVEKMNPGLSLPRAPTRGFGCNNGCPDPTPIILPSACAKKHLPPWKCAKDVSDYINDIRPGKVSPDGGGSGGQGGGGSGGQGGGGSGGQGGGGSTKWEPLGELVSADLELAGLKGQPVLLSWSIFQKNGPSHLSGKWLGNFVAYSLVPTTNDDTGTVVMWIPLPKQKGPYFVRLTLTTGGASLGSMNSGPFG